MKNKTPVYNIFGEVIEHSTFMKEEQYSILKVILGNQRELLKIRNIIKTIEDSGEKRELKDLTVIIFTSSRQEKK